MGKILDCRKLECPQPVIRCREQLSQGRPATIEVIVDNMAAVENVSRFLKRNGYEPRAMQTAESEWHVLATASGEAPEPDMSTAPAAEKTLVLLTTETLGRGDDELGAKLMETFLANLAELGSSLWRVILLNGAVKLTAHEGKPLEQLKALQSAGVSILVCGTCLGHYGLLDKKQVGETTNMMDVISSLGLAQKVIRP